jgi:lysophosphatidate acyltransferase
MTADDEATRMVSATATPLALPTTAAAAKSQERIIGPRVLRERSMGIAETWLRLGLGLSWFAVTSVVFAMSLVFFIPWRAMRVKIANVYGTWAGRGASWLTGCQFVVRGEENTHAPCIYVANHASILDIFLGIWLSPIGTCGVAKKEIIYYPFFGQFYWLAGHLCIDRGNNSKAVEAMKKLAAFVNGNRLSVFIWPEGTRATDGRLQPFKRGAFHLALATGLPLVPVVFANTHRAWPNRSLTMNRVSVTATFLPPISTAGWTKETLDTHMEELRGVFASALPADQQPAAQPPAR